MCYTQTKSVSQLSYGDDETTESRAESKVNVQKAPIKRQVQFAKINNYFAKLQKYFTHVADYPPFFPRDIRFCPPRAEPPRPKFLFSDSSLPHLPRARYLFFRIQRTNCTWPISNQIPYVIQLYKRESSSIPTRPNYPSLHRTSASTKHVRSQLTPPRRPSGRTFEQQTGSDDAFEFAFTIS